jgi:glycosyltransferase involved in cell wall biosynthesis
VPDAPSGPIRVLSPHCGVRPDTHIAAAASGGERYERMLLTRLPDYGIELELGLPRSRSLRADEIPAGWRVTALPPGLRWYVAPLAFVPYTASVLRRRPVHLLRGHSVLYTGPSLFAARALTRTRVPIVLHHLHTEGSLARFEGALLRRADAIVTISAFSAGQLADAGVVRHRVHVIPPGVARPHARPIPAPPWPGDGLRLLLVGPLVGRKRPLLALQTLRELQMRGVDAGLVVVGDGPLRDGLQRAAAELEVGTSIRFAGPVSEEQKWGFFEAADALLFPSALEGFGFAAAEAQRAGLPVVAAAGTSVAEIVHDGETGFLTEADASTFAEATQQLADPQVRARLSANSRERSERFNWDDVARRVADVYAAVAAVRSGH